MTDSLRAAMAFLNSVAGVICLWLGTRNYLRWLRAPQSATREEGFRLLIIVAIGLMFVVSAVVVFWSLHKKRSNNPGPFLGSIKP